METAKSAAAPCKGFPRIISTVYILPHPRPLFKMKNAKIAALYSLIAECRDDIGAAQSAITNANNELQGRVAK